MSSNNPIIEKLTLVTSAGNKIWRASQGYKSGTTELFINGLAVVSTADDGWTESDPSAGEITLTENAQIDDIISMYYEPA